MQYMGNAASLGRDEERMLVIFVLSRIATWRNQEIAISL